MSKHFQTVATMACMKSLLMIFNLAFWASGLAILCAGIWMQVELHRYLELNANFSNTGPYVLVGTGALILLISSLACCCTVKGQPSLLYLYGAFLAVVFVIELSLASSIYAYKDNLADGFDRGLNQSMTRYGLPGTEEKTGDFDTIQARMQCCGIHSYEDWYNLNPTRPVPRSCCREVNSRCDTQDETLIWTQGCFQKVVDFLTTNMKVIAGAAAGVTLFPLLGTVLSCILAANINKTKYEQMA
ncbi:tetraspanin-7-like [Phlebotomus papatasi]|uniref:Tetraspanin n=1 Tax=Phlebotomus papatasi TaxID=29031 RepID=A0A1B0D099_PHLPP|nr:tetraspanin-7-like [Phlebotomus papatasi]